MDNLPQHIIDAHLRKVAEDGDFPFREDAWADLDERLDARDRQQRRKRGAALALLLGLLAVATAYFLRPPSVALTPAAAPVVEAPTAREAVAVPNAGSELPDAVPAVDAPTVAATAASTTTQRSAQLPTTGTAVPTAGTVESTRLYSGISNINTTPPAADATGSALPPDALDAVRTAGGAERATDSALVPATALPDENSRDADHRLPTLLANLVPAQIATSPPALTLGGAGKITPTAPTRSRWSVAAYAGVEANGASGLNEATAVNNRFGFRVDYALNDKLTVGAGLAYGSREYCTPGSNYTAKPGFWVDGVKPVSVECDMRITEIPVALRYYSRGRNADGFYFGAGLNSYRMDRETYRFNYNAAEIPSDAILDWEERGTAAHYLGIATLTAGYQTKVSDRLLLRIAPYYHLPLQGIGIGQVQLQTFGLQVETALIGRRR